MFYVMLALGSAATAFVVIVFARADRE